MDINAVIALFSLDKHTDMAFFLVKTDELLVTFAPQRTPHGAEIQGFQKIGLPLSVAAVDHIDALGWFYFQLCKVSEILEGNLCDIHIYSPAIHKYESNYFLV